MDEPVFRSCVEMLLACVCMGATLCGHLLIGAILVVLLSILISTKEKQRTVDFS